MHTVGITKSSSIWKSFYLIISVRTTCVKQFQKQSIQMFIKKSIISDKKTLIIFVCKKLCKKIYTTDKQASQTFIAEQLRSYFHLRFNVSVKNSV